MSKYTILQIKEYLNWYFELGKVPLVWLEDNLVIGEHGHGASTTDEATFVRGAVTRADMDRAIDSLAPGLWKRLDSEDALEAMIKKFSDKQQAVARAYILHEVIQWEQMYLVATALREMLGFLNGVQTL